MDVKEETKSEQNQLKQAVVAEKSKDLQTKQDVAPLSVASSTEDIINGINSATDSESLKDLTKLFNLAMVKKEIARTLKQSELLDLVINQVADRLQKRPDELSNKELTDFMNAFQDSINASQNNVEMIDSNPITAIDKHSEVNINIGGEQLDRDSRDKVMNAVKSILSDIGKKSSPPSDVIDAECQDKDVKHDDSKVVQNPVPDEKKDDTTNKGQEQ
jgi:hypothetical protein